MASKRRAPLEDVIEFLARFTDGRWWTMGHESAGIHINTA